MRVLLISHTALSRTNNMGKTLLSYLSDFKPGEVAQLYIHSEVPTDDTICTDYYRFTDIDAVKSILNPMHHGNIYEKDDIEKDRVIARTDEGIVNSAYVLGSKRKAWSMNAREIAWKLAHWKRKELKDWIGRFDPEVILFASGDYTFMYDIAYWIAEYYDKPLVTICVDDYYIHRRNSKSLFGRLHYTTFMKSVKKTIARSSCVFTLSDLMNDAYTKLFHKPCFTVHNSLPKIVSPFNAEGKNISYIGNLGFGRVDQLVTIGKALHDLERKTEPTAVDVYTGSFNNEYLDKLRKAEGIRLHGRISADEVMNVMKASLATIHTESFDPENKELVRYSVSTKIAESLMYGPCLIAYGPEGIASIDYLKENKAAYVITRPEDLKSDLQEILTNAELREQIVKNARRLAAENHDEAVNPKKVREWLQQAIDSGT